MSGHQSLITVEKRILLHLLNCHDSKHKSEVSVALTRNGIAQALATNRSYIPRPLETLVTEGFVKEFFGRVKGRKKKQKYFKLTIKGKEHSKKLKNDLSNLEVTVKRADGASKMMPLKNIIPYLEKEKICSDITELEVYKIISKDRIFDIEQLKIIRNMKIVDFSAEAPMVLRFFGRKREIAALKKWVADEKGHNIIFVHGMAGIGKTTLAAKLIESYRQSKHLFWHNFHDLDTPRGILLKMAKFLSELGHDHLEMHLRTRTSLDYHEVSGILGKSVGVIDAVLVFDDFHKSNDEIRAFFVYILKMLTSSSKTKMLILSREIVPFYDRRDVLSRKIVAELELEGLDFESSKRLLKGKGIDKSRFKQIYGLTAGNPLFLEILESKDHLERYMHDELISKLAKDEKKILGILSIYRFPVPEESLAMYSDFDFEKHYALMQKSIVKKDAYDRYFVHDIIKRFFYSRLSPSKRRGHHLLAARWYKDRDEPLDIIEGIYHYQEAGEYKKASQFAIDRSASIFEGGFAAELLATLETFDKKNIETGVWAEILILKGKACNMVGEWKKALLYFAQSADIATLIGNKKLEVKAICESGHILEEQNEYDEAMDCFKKGLGISKEADYSQGIGEGYRGIGRIHWRKSQHDKAISELEKCIEISKKSDNLDLIASAYIDLGNVYDERYEIEKAIECYNRGLDILKKVKNPQEIARAYLNLAITYKHIYEFDKAIEYNTKQLTLAQNLRDITLIGYGYAEISHCYAHTNEFEKARKYAKKAEEIAEKIGSENIAFELYRTYALICKEEKRWDDAANYFKKSIEIAKRLNAKYILPDTHFELGALYKEIGDAENAKKYVNIAKQLYSKFGLEKNKLVREKLSKIGITTEG